MESAKNPSATPIMMKSNMRTFLCGLSQHDPEIMPVEAIY
jgi:hypothetical protein